VTKTQKADTPPGEKPEARRGGPFHGLANVFPLLPPGELAALADDIKANGQRDDIVRLDGLILDGRDRWLACQDAGIQPRERDYDPARDGPDPVAFVVSANIRRRHLSAAQRALAAAELATMRQGERTDLPSREGRSQPVSQAQAAALLGVGVASVERAAKVRRDGAAELVEAIKDGAVPVKVAAEAATLPKDQQAAVVAEVRQGKPARKAVAERLATPPAPTMPAWRAQAEAAPPAEDEDHQVGKLVPPVKRHGGKRYLARHVLRLMPPHLHYVEPYFGGGQVFFARDPADRRLWWRGLTSDRRKADGVSEVIKDLDGDLMNFYAVLKDAATFEALRRLVGLTLFSEGEWEAAGGVLAGGEAGHVERAAAFFVRNRLSLAGRMDSFTGTTRTRLRGGRNGDVNAYWNAIDGLAAVHARLRDAVVLSRPALEVIRREDGEGTLFYCDPPYMPGTRTAPEVYRHEMTVQDHEEMLDALKGVKGMVMLSGYANDLYDTALAGWHREVVEVPNNAAGGKTKRRMQEVIWCNFKPAAQ
jgi:DNA adenine methylase